MEALKTFEEKLKFGEVNEIKIAKMLIKKGYAVLALSQFVSENHSPNIEWRNPIGAEEKIISPDLICFSPKKGTVFIEVKTKTRWIKFENKEETGVDLRLYNHYKALKNILGYKFFILFVHEEESPCGIFCVEISTEYNRVWNGLNAKTGKKVSPQMVLWRKEQLKEIIDCTKPTPTPNN